MEVKGRDCKATGVGWFGEGKPQCFVTSLRFSLQQQCMERNGNLYNNHTVNMYFYLNKTSIHYVV